MRQADYISPDGSVKLYCANSLDLSFVADESVDSVVCDPPYELGFMGKSWDSTGIAYSVDLWREVFRVLKPGGHLLSFGGTRTYHRMACAIEDAGFEIRDQIQYVYGSGFPKSLDVSKAIDKAAGVYVPGDVLPSSRTTGASASEIATSFRIKTSANPQTDSAKQWQGWGTALKPANEPICMARKPLIGTVAENVLKYGTGALNIDGCRVKLSEGDDPRLGGNGDWATDKAAQSVYEGGYAGERIASSPLGRWPSNFIHDGSDEVVREFPQSNGGAFPKKSNVPPGVHYGGGWGCVDNGERTEMGDGSAARFFYCAKASKSERRNSKHPTIKPLALMRYLVRLVTPPNGTVLDPFCGSGTTIEAAQLEGFAAIGIDQSEKSIADSIARVSSNQGIFTGAMA